MKYPLAEPAIFWTIQGESHLSGQGQVFVRTAGCSVGCNACDTDYAVRSRMTVEEIVEAVRLEFPSRIQGRDRMVWISGGEPTDHDLGPLLDGFKNEGLSVALATSGVRPVRYPVDWLSVSPHGPLAQTFGHEIKIIPDLNQLDPWAWLKEYDDRLNFWLRFFQPLDGDPDSMALCKELWKAYPHWGISIQTHKLIGLP